MLSKAKNADASFVEWKGVQVGMLINVAGAIIFGWLAVSICSDDGTIIVQDGETGVWSRVADDDTVAIAHANTSVVFDR
eukprot:COSAG01_NODE_15255_length_1357_cov_1.217011_2_plen_79_part_00